MTNTIPQPPHGGPYETEREAIAAARHILDTPPGTGAWQEGSLALLMDACADAGIAVGAYDSRILHWLTGWEPQTVAVIAGLITRAHVGRAPKGLGAEELHLIFAALDLAADELRDRAANCAECDGHPAELCTTCEGRLERANEYDQLAERLPAVTR